MGLWQTNLIAIGLSLDVFAYCLYKGAMVSQVKKAEITKMVAIFTAFQTGMLIVGNAITWIPVIRDSYESATRIWKFMASLLFFGLGILMIVKSFTHRNRKIEEHKQDDYNYRVITFWAFVMSLDALIAGVGFGFLGLGLIVMALIVAIITAACAIVGFIAGYRLGCGPMNRFVTVGGCLVLIGGIDLFANYVTAIR